MTLAEEIAYWKEQAEKAESRELMLFCFGVVYGLQQKASQTLKRKPDDVTLQEMSKEASEISDDWRVQQKIMFALVRANLGGLQDARDQALAEAQDCTDDGQKNRCLNIATACLHMMKAREP